MDSVSPGMLFTITIGISGWILQILHVQSSFLRPLDNNNQGSGCQMYLGLENILRESDLNGGDCIIPPFRWEGGEWINFLETQHVGNTGMGSGWGQGRHMLGIVTVHCYQLKWEGVNTVLELKVVRVERFFGSVRSSRSAYVRHPVHQ